MSIILSNYWKTLQGSLFSGLSETFPEALTEKHKQLAAILEICRVEDHVPVNPSRSRLGRPRHELHCMARAFIAKSVYNMPATNVLIDSLRTDSNLRLLCGWSRRKDIPSATTFSRAFSIFEKINLGDKIHEAQVNAHVSDYIVMHVSLDSTEVAAREKAAKKEKPSKEKKKRGRPRKGEKRPAPEEKRLDVQLRQSPEEALNDLPKNCDWGAKLDTGGHMHNWKGYKAHIVWGDGMIPLNVVTTSASVHDSQLAIPLMRSTAQRVISCYDLMDGAYDAPQIRQVSQELGHVPLIDPNPRRYGVPEEKMFDPAMKRRYNERTNAERGNGRLKDEFGFRFVRVRGNGKVHLHLMFGIIALFADQLIKPFVGA